MSPPASGQIWSSASAMSVWLPTPKPSGTSAICAAVGSGRYPDLKTAARAMVHIRATVEPDPTVRDTYDRGYERYRALQTALTPEFARD